MSTWAGSGCLGIGQWMGTWAGEFLGGSSFFEVGILARGCGWCKQDRYFEEINFAGSDRL